MPQQRCAVRGGDSVCHSAARCAVGSVPRSLLYLEEVLAAPNTTYRVLLLRLSLTLPLPPLDPSLQLSERH